MDLHRGIALGLAPRFQSALAWSDRLQLNGGVEARAGHVYPRCDWRRPSPHELGLLLAADPVQMGLLNLPAHVRGEWWAIAEGAGGLPGDDARYRAFVDGVLAFLRFKDVPLPDRCRVDVHVSRPGQPSTRWDPVAGCPGGLAFGARGGDPALDEVASVINLGDEFTHLVFLNLAPPAMAGMAGLPWPAGTAPGPDLLERFFAALPTYPLVRVQLEPGDGLWLPPRGIAHDVSTLDKREVDVALTIHAAGAWTA